MKPQNGGRDRWTEGKFTEQLLVGAQSEVKGQKDGLKTEESVVRL